MDPPRFRPLRLGAVAVDLRDGRIEGANPPVRLTSFETELLRYFVERAGRAVPREDLIRHVWKAPVSERAVDQAVRRLRRRLEPGRRHSSVLLSVRGVGYRFIVPREPTVHAPISPLGSLDAWLKAAFAACCAFRGSFGVAAARHVAQVPEAALRALARHGLLAAVRDGGQEERQYAVVEKARVEAPPDAVERLAAMSAANVAGRSAVLSA